MDQFNFKVLVGRGGVFVAKVTDSLPSLREHAGSVRERARIGYLPTGELAGLSERQARKLAADIRSAPRRRRRQARA